MTLSSEAPRIGATTWQEQAACRGYTGLFYSHVPADRQQARDICHACPVLDECRAYWIDHVTADDVRSGAIVAGVSARTIKRWRTQRQAVAS